jgi:alpha/beta superfamily hydrolase
MVSQTQRRVRFTGGAFELSAVIHEPADGSVADTVLLSHCFTCSKDYKIIVAIARRLAGQGLRAVRFDFAGSGQSAGRFSDANLSTNVSDIVAAAAWIRSQDWTTRALVGHSLGGVATILAARRLPEVVAVCAISTPSSATHLLRLLPSLGTEEFQRTGSAEVTIGGRKVRINKQFVEDLRRDPLEQAVARLGRGLLVVQGTHDETTPLEEAERLFGYARQPKAFIAVPGATHLFPDRRHAAMAARAVSLWLGVCGLKVQDAKMED